MQNQLSFQFPNTWTEEGWSSYFLPKRKRPLPRKTECRAWLQLAFQFVMKTLTRAQQGFTWTREDGKKVWCKNIAALVTAIKEYDGFHSKLLPPQLRFVPGAEEWGSAAWHQDLAYLERKQIAKSNAMKKAAPAPKKASRTGSKIDDTWSWPAGGDEAQRKH